MARPARSACASIATSPNFPTSPTTATCPRCGAKRPGSGRIGRRKQHGDGGSDPGLAADVEPTAMALDDVLDDRQTEAGAADPAAARRIDPIEALGQPRNMLGGDALALVGDPEPQHFPVEIERDVHRAVGP